MTWLRQTATGALLRGEGWCVALTPAELTDVCTQAQQLQTLLSETAGELMEAEDLEITAQTERIELILSGYPQQFKLVLQLRQGRRFEGEWPLAVGYAVLRELAGNFLLRASH